MATTKKTAKKKVTQKQYEDAAKRYGQNAAKASKIIDASEERIKKELERRHERLGKIPDELKEDEAIIIQYAEDNKDALLPVGKKSVDTGLGVVVKWRTGKHALIYGEGVTEEDLVKAFKSRRLKVYVKTKETLDAQKVITDRENPKVVTVLEEIGVEVKQGETVKVDIKNS